MAKATSGGLEDNLSSLSLDFGDQSSAPAAGDAQAPAATAAATEPPATPAAPEPAAAPAPAVGADEPRLNGVAAQMRSWGYDVDDDATDDDVRQHLQTLEERAEKLDQANKELESLRQWRAQIEAQRQAEPAAPAAPVPAKPAEPAAAATTTDDLGIPERPQLDRATLGILQVAQSSGVLKEGVGGLIATDDPNIKPFVDAYNKHQIELREYDATWTPRKVAETLYEQRAAKDRAERDALRKELEDFKAAQQVDKVQAEIDAYFDKNKAAYFQLDANGEPVFDPQRNIYVGDGYARYMAAAQEAVQFGITDRAAIHRYAVKHAPPAPVQEAPATKVVKFRNRLKNNGHGDTLSTTPVARPSAGAATRNYSGLSLNQQLASNFSSLMNESVGERP